MKKVGPGRNSGNVAMSAQPLAQSVNTRDAKQPRIMIRAKQPRIMIRILVKMFLGLYSSYNVHSRIDGSIYRKFAIKYDL